MVMKGDANGRDNDCEAYGNNTDSYESGRIER